ncbi:MAG: putative adenylylsulfate reductase-associated electron transfer protein QmoA [Ignavibacteria bacterium]|nr:putative adenylylsulfate reductase-associated electron transfer protein QmoA [Ignavibacteria bacterium]
MQNKLESDSIIHANVLVVGAGIAGITSAVELSEIGKKVILVEKEPYIGGRILQMNKYFPKMCPPSCGFEINLKRLRTNPGIEIHTLSEVQQITGTKGDYNVVIKKKPRFVNSNCTLCKLCEEVCPVERKNEYNYNMNNTKAAYLPFDNSFPATYVIDSETCKGVSCNECLKVCPVDAINLEEKEENLEFNVGAIIWATGWSSYNAEKLDNLGLGKFPNVVTNTLFERMASANGHLSGNIVRPSDNKAIEKIAFVQCAGSRDENHLPYCSSVCCMASMKQATYVREKYPNAEIHFFFIDVRSPGRLEDFYTNLKKDNKMFFHRGKVAKIIENKENANLIVEAENTLTTNLTVNEFDMVVLAVGMAPNVDGVDIINKSLDENGFLKSDNIYGIIGAGVACAPRDVAGVVKEATGAAMKAIKILRRA